MKPYAFALILVRFLALGLDSGGREGGKRAFEERLSEKLADQM